MTLKVENLTALFRPRSVAVIGATKTPSDRGLAVLRSLLRAEFEGPVLPVSTQDSLLGVLCHRSVEALPLAPDLAVVCTPPETLPDVVHTLGRRGTRAAILLTAAHDAASAAALRPALHAAAKRHGVRILGPNSSGIQVPRAHLNASWMVTRARPGNIALVSQSGSLIAGILSWAESRAIGFSHVISSGEGVDVDLGDLLDHLATDGDVHALLMYLKSVDEPRKFLSAARALARVKPVIAIRPSRGEGATAIALPDGQVLPGVDGDAVYDAAIDRAGMLRVRDVEDLFDAGEMLTHGRRPRGEQLIIVSNGAGAGDMALGALIEGGGKVAPLGPETRARLAALLPGRRLGPVVDIGRDARPGLHREVAAALHADPGVDAILFVHAANVLSPSEAFAIEVAEVARASDRFLLACCLGADPAGDVHRLLLEAGIASYATPEKAARAFLRTVNYQRSQYLLVQAPSTAAPDKATSRMRARARAVVVAALEEGRRWLRADEGTLLLECYGIAAQPGPPAAGADDAAARRATALCLMAGIATDPVFGRVIHVGPGGQQKLIGEGGALALPPLNMVLAEDMIARTRIADMVATFNRAPIDELALRSLLVRLSDMAVDLPELAVLQINPLLADGAGVLAVGIHLAVEPASADRPGVAIRPYPGELEEEIALRDGQSLFVRPVRPEDEQAYAGLLAHTGPAELSTRFREPGPVPRQVIQQLVHIDYDREMTFVAVKPDGEGGPEIVGMVDSTTGPGNREIDVTMFVRDDMRRLGLGRALMEKMIRYCRSRGAETVVARVPRSSVAALSMDFKLGFQPDLEIETTDDAEERMILRLG